jgi:hypothetical protein
MHFFLVYNYILDKTNGSYQLRPTPYPSNSAQHRGKQERP